ncbi:hypothetical protein SLI_4678 [Streptomyces lividans 1326]|uniref:Uncharacterized protein n=1 Tax=Streptomyces lividans 1326 TaxID=1200984 RepID=A0A7U9DXE1_STRLI|nr:hypothetical protein SLI_4678 [Streptomyces lividans 1326]
MSRLLLWAVSRSRDRRLPRLATLARAAAPLPPPFRHLRGRGRPRGRGTAGAGSAGRGRGPDGPAVSPAGSACP